MVYSSVAQLAGNDGIYGEIYGDGDVFKIPNRLTEIRKEERLVN
jgi:hypothetical protein